jgi:hypothetical protein
MEDFGAVIGREPVHRSLVLTLGIFAKHIGQFGIRRQLCVACGP